MRILRAVKADKLKSHRRRPVNLTLSADAIRKGHALKKVLVRESFSSVAEFLIVQAWKQSCPSKKQEVAA
jgi:hypothetical protein